MTLLLLLLLLLLVGVEKVMCVSNVDAFAVHVVDADRRTMLVLDATLGFYFVKAQQGARLGIVPVGSDVDNLRIVFATRRDDAAVFSQ